MAETFLKRILCCGNGGWINERRLYIKIFGMMTNLSFDRELLIGNNEVCVCLSKRGAECLKDD